MIKVMIADDQALIRESLQIILSAHQDIQVTSAVADGHEVLERIPPRSTRCRTDGYSYAQDGWCDGDKRSQGTLP